jgi:hypothetical protein
MMPSTPRVRAPRSATTRRAAAAVAVFGLGAVVLASATGATAPPDSETSTTTTAAHDATDSSVLPVGYEELASGLLSAEVLGVPPDWVIRDVDATVADDREQFAATDPFLGLLDCPEGTIREGSDRSWLARRYSAPEVPLENGLLFIEIIIEIESVDEWQQDREALDVCETAEYAEIHVDAGKLTPPGSTIDESETTASVAVELLSSPTAEVPYPAAFNATSVNRDDRTVTVVLGGVDMGESWQHLADEIAGTALAALPPPPDQ